MKVSFQLEDEDVKKLMDLGNRLLSECPSPIWDAVVETLGEDVSVKGNAWASHRPEGPAVKVIDAHTGRLVKVGDTLPIPGDGSTPELSAAGIGVDGYYKVVAITPGILSAKILLASNHPAYNGWVPLAVRWTHPRFFLQHVAFIPS